MASDSEPAVSQRSIRVWDLPVRVCHFGFALLIPGLWWTGENAYWLLHKRLGLCLLALLIFRILWGIIGTRTARFASFVRGPAAVVRYFANLQTGTGSTVGHNPAGGWSVIALLLAMLAQTTTGLFAGDPFDGATGPLNDQVGVMMASQLTDWHTWFYNVVLALVGLHLAAVLYYAAIRKDNLVGPMLTGRRTFTDGVTGNDQSSPIRGAISGVLAIAVIAWIITS